MTTNTDLLYVRPGARVDVLSSAAVVLEAQDAAGNTVTMFFDDDNGDNDTALDQAAAWLRDALDQVQVAKMIDANGRNARVALAATIGEPIDLAVAP